MVPAEHRCYGPTPKVFLFSAGYKITLVLSYNACLQCMPTCFIWITILEAFCNPSLVLCRFSIHLLTYLLDGWWADPKPKHDVINKKTIESEASSFLFKVFDINTLIFIFLASDPSSPFFFNYLLQTYQLNFFLGC